MLCVLSLITLLQYGKFIKHTIDIELKLIPLSFQLCLNLYNFYRECYSETQKEMMEAADERPFDCSDMYIFGKFETFRVRLEKVTC